MSLFLDHIIALYGYHKTVKGAFFIKNCELGYVSIIEVIDLCFFCFIVH